MLCTLFGALTLFFFFGVRIPFLMPYHFLVPNTLFLVPKHIFFGLQIPLFETLSFGALISFLGVLTLFLVRPFLVPHRFWCSNTSFGVQALFFGAQAPFGAQYPFWSL